MSQTATMYPHALRLSAPRAGEPQAVVTADDLTTVGEHVHELLARAYALPCKKAAEAFLELVQPMARFTVALHIFRPLVLEGEAEPMKRILVAYILYFMYAVRPIRDNPFYEVLRAAFQIERTRSVSSASGREQLAWVLWKIMKGDGQDIDPFSPSTLARSPLPPQLQPANLSLDDDKPSVLQNIESERPKFDPFSDDEKISRENGHARQKLQYDSPRDEERQKLSDAVTLLLAARDKVLSISEQRMLTPLIAQLTSPPVITSTDLHNIILRNPPLAFPLVKALLSSLPSFSTPDEPNLYLNVLRSLPPILPAVDLIFRLLHEPTVVPDVSTGGRTTIADLVRTEVLGWFVNTGIEWCEEDEESDGKRERGARTLCRFYTSLLKHGMVDPSSDADSAEMMAFALRHSRLEEATALYRALALGKL